MLRTMMSFIRLAAAVLLLTIGASLVNTPMVWADPGTDCFPRDDYACLVGEPYEDYLCEEIAEDCHNCKKHAGVCNGGGLGSLQGYITFAP